MRRVCKSMTFLAIAKAGGLGAVLPAASLDRAGIRLFSDSACSKSAKTGCVLYSLKRDGVA